MMDLSQRRRTLAVDLDGTLVEAQPDTAFDWRRIGQLKPGAYSFLSAVKAAGWLVIIYTCRPELNQLREWADFTLPGLIDGINCNPEDVAALRCCTTKPFATVYLDDKAWPLVGTEWDWAKVHDDFRKRGWLND